MIGPLATNVKPLTLSLSPPHVNWSKGEEKSVHKLFSDNRISSSRCDDTHLRAVSRLSDGQISYSQKNHVWLITGNESHIAIYALVLWLKRIEHSAVTYWQLDQSGTLVCRKFSTAELKSPQGVELRLVSYQQSGAVIGDRTRKRAEYQVLAEYWRCSHDMGQIFYF